MKVSSEIKSINNFWLLKKSERTVTQRKLPAIKIRERKKIFFAQLNISHFFLLLAFLKKTDFLKRFSEKRH